MTSPRTIALCALLTVSGLVVAGSPASAAGATTGSERFDGFLVASGTSGTRHVVSTRIVARGVFDGVGRLVEIPSRPSDPDNVNRDDLVFRAGRMHLRTVNGPVDFHLDQRTCVFHATVPQTGTVQGGTGRFRHATGRFTGRVDARGVAPRDADGRCTGAAAPLVEVDVLAASGSLTF